MVKAGTASIEFKSRPVAALPEMRFTAGSREDSGKVMLFQLSTPIEPIGSCTIESRGESLKGSRLGFVQLLKESSFAIYHGLTPDDGSILVRKAGNDSNRWRKCRDVLDDPLLVDSKHGGIKNPIGVVDDDKATTATLTARYQDPPDERYFTQLMNTSFKSPRPNFIDEVRIEFNFCVVLTFIPPNGKPQFLKHFKWHINWNFGFGPPDPKLGIPGEQRSGFGAGIDGKIIDGPPKDDFGAMLTNTSLATCESLVKEAERKVKAGDAAFVQHSAKKSKFGLI